MMDWASFGYGAGLLATAWAVGDASSEVYGRLWLWRHRLQVALAERHVRQDHAARITQLQATVAGQQDMLIKAVEVMRQAEQVHNETLEKLQVAEQQLVADEKWEAYKERRRLNRQTMTTVKLYQADLAKRGVPLGRAAASKPVSRLQRCSCGHFNGVHHMLVGSCTACQCDQYSKPVKQPQRLDGLGWAGTPGTVCGRGMCCLSEGHEAGCIV